MVSLEEIMVLSPDEITWRNYGIVPWWY